MLFRNNGGGFVVAEFAIALPLLILLMYGLATVSVKVFDLGRGQLADYVLESEAQYVMERITRIARTAREVNIANRKVKFVYHTVADKKYYESMSLNEYYVFLINDVLETQYFILSTRAGRTAPNLYAERQDKYFTNPITGDNYFGDTKINYLSCEVDEGKKILYVSLEMESLVTAHKIKLNTAVYMPGYGAGD